MSLKDYSDDEDYYTQDFDCSGAVSIWVGILGEEVNAGADILQDLCGVGYYRMDDQEINNFDFNLIDVRQLLSGLSYSFSFLDNAVVAAKKLGLNEARWIVAQYDFKYDPSKITRLIESDPVFIGFFEYSDT